MSSITKMTNLHVYILYGYLFKRIFCLTFLKYFDIHNLIPLCTCLTHREQHVISYHVKTDLYHSVKNL